MSLRISALRFLRGVCLAAVLFAGGLFSYAVCFAMAVTVFMIPGTSEVLYSPSQTRTPPTPAQAEGQFYGLLPGPITSVGISNYPASVVDMNKSIDDGVADLAAFFGSEEFKNADGPVYVKGTSQGALVITRYLQRYANDPDAPQPGSVVFVLEGNPANPNGGITDRFPGLKLPPMGGPLPGATPDTDYKVVSINKQYDFYANFPRNPLNPLATLNAFFGLADHASYADVDVDDPRNTTTVVGNTTYITVYAERLPILMPVRLVTDALGIKTPVLDNIIEPMLRVLIETAHDRENVGVPTSADPFYSSMTPMETLTKLAEVFHQGVQNLVRGNGKQPVAEVTDTSESSDETVDRQTESSETGNRKVAVQDSSDAQEPVKPVSTMQTSNDSPVSTEEPEQTGGIEEKQEVSSTKTEPSVPTAKENEHSDQKPADNKEEVSKQSDKLTKFEVRKQKREERKAERAAKEAAKEAAVNPSKDADKDEDSSKQSSNDNAEASDGNEDKAAA